MGGHHGRVYQRGNESLSWMQKKKPWVGNLYPRPEGARDALWENPLQFHPHAKIKSIDTLKAEKVPGVKAVLTGYNIPPSNFGVYKDNIPLKANKSLLSADEIRCGRCHRP